MLRFGYDQATKIIYCFVLQGNFKRKLTKVTLLTGDKFFLLKAGDDIKVEYVKQINNTAKRKSLEIKVITTKVVSWP